MVVKIAVIGAGVVGLSSAISLQQRLPEASVEVIADKFTRHTTSHGAGGIFVPTAPGVPKALEERWGRDGAEHYFGLAMSSQSSSCGVNFMTGFELTNSDKLPYWEKLMINVRDIPSEFEPILMKNYKKGYMFTTVLIENAKYLPWLTEKFVASGGRITHRTIHSFAEVFEYPGCKLADDYDLIVNCAGLRAGQLAGDPRVQPMRGHILRVSAPWIKHFVHSDNNRYIIPGTETVAVGGTRQLGRSDMEPEAHESERILREMMELFPPLKGARVLWEWIGLRPYRDSVRVQAELIASKGKQFKVIHNYGHGAYGVSLSWGTGQYTAELAQQALAATPKL